MGQVTPAGYVAERIDQIVADLERGFLGIYGNDINVDPESPDGQVIGLISQVKADLEELGGVIYRQLDPDWASGVWLEQRVAYAGLKKKLASYSYLRNVILTGRADAAIPSEAIVSDQSRVRWRLVSAVTLDGAGSARADFRSEELGAFQLPAGTVLKIETVVLGWTSATTLSDAEVGKEEETDPQLRARFFRSRAKPATNDALAIEAKIGDLPDVRQVICLENYTDVMDADGVPPHSINVVVDGGDSAAIAGVIFDNKTLGTGMLGDTVVELPITKGRVKAIRFDRPAITSCAAQIIVRREANFLAIDIDAIKAAVAGTSFLIGDDVLLTRLYTPINTVSGFWVSSLKIGPVGSTLSEDNIVVGPRGMARFAVEDIEVIVL